MNKVLTEKYKIISKELVEKYLKLQNLFDMQKELFKTKNKCMNNIKLDLIVDGLKKLQDNSNRKMSKDEIDIEKPYEIVNIVERILYFNNQKPRRTRIKNIDSKINA